ncbi:DUF6283 family protein [Amycolatopsis sp. NPDC098790]|uniref:DUF6283 family protein n=1 Tax=Amycolatopsis sp. NPDC098790 TaxID=3363939 RepID=UPI0037FC2503
MPEPTEHAGAAAQGGAEVIAIREGANGWGVVTITSPDGAFQEEPCPRCPWRRDAPIGAFPPEVFRLSAPTTYDWAEKLFGCHGSKRDAPKTCAGFLLRGAAHNATVRLNGPDITDVSSSHPLYDTYKEMAIANGVAADDPVLAPCRDSRPPNDTSLGRADIDADQRAATVTHTERLIRAFLVESAGLDAGDAMTADAALLAGRLGAAGHLGIPQHPKFPAGTSALEIIRQFVVECVGDDLGADTDEVAEQLRRYLASAAVLGGVHEPIPLTPSTHA